MYLVCIGCDHTIHASQLHQVVRLFERGLAVAGAVLGARDIWVVLEVSAAEALRTDPVVKNNTH